MAKRFRYLNPDCEMTLAEGLDEYTSAYSFLNNNDGKTEASTWFRKHDLTHVVFGTLPFEIRGEPINNLWTIFGSDVTLKGYVQFFSATQISYNTIIKSYIPRYGNRFSVYWEMVRQIPISCVTVVRALKMTRKWPWHHPEAYLTRSLKDIRVEFGIRLIDAAQS